MNSEKECDTIQYVSLSANQFSQSVSHKTLDLSTKKRFKADVRALSLHSDEGLTPEMSAFNLFMVANLPHHPKS